MRKIVGFLSAVILVAALGSIIVEMNRRKTGREQAEKAAASTRTRARDSLLAHVAQHKLEVQNAAANPRLVTAVRGRVDNGTLEDLFRSEQWWEPSHAEFKVYAIAMEHDLTILQGGMNGAEFSADLLVRLAREQRQPVSEMAIVGGVAYVAAATLISTPERTIAPVLVLAKPLDDEVLRKLSENAQGAVLLSDGRTAVIAAGSLPERDLLHGAVGSESKAPFFALTDGGGVAGVDKLAPGLWMWTYPNGIAESSAAGTQIAIWSVASMASMLAVFLLYRGSSAGNETAGSIAGWWPWRLKMKSQSTPDRASSAADHATNEGDGGQMAQIFGRYRLLDRLGAGGMAQVYTAVTFGAEGFRRMFVVKRLHAELARHPSVVAQFIDEANLGSTLVHSNIVPVFDFGKVGNEYFLAQEYILGRDLSRVTARMMEREGIPLSPSMVLHVARETLKALDYAHTKHEGTGRPLGIVHRDVSPDNVLISALGEVKLLDFGIVKADGRVSKTQDGVLKGTVTFMSPEQARAADVDARADLFSLGLVIYYCVTGEALYRGNATHEVLLRASQGPGTDELARLADLPAPFPEILLKALRVNPSERYQTAAEFGTALSPYVGDIAGEMVRLMRTLFAADFRQEEARFAAGAPSATSMFSVI